MLGLGLGLNRYKILGSSGPPVDPRITAAITANATMLLMGDLATGTSKGVNVPFTTPWVDQINSNDATLTNFAETITSGWDDVTVPSGTEAMLKGDGVDDYCVIADNASLDPTGTEDFAMCFAFKTGVDLNEILLAKSSGGTAQAQYAIYLRSSGRIDIFLNGDLTIASATELIQLNMMHSLEVKRVSSVLKVILDGVEIHNAVNTEPLVSKTMVSIMAISTDSIGSSYTLFSKSSFGYVAFFYNGATGLNETDVDNACALLRAPYF